MVTEQIETLRSELGALEAEAARVSRLLSQSEAEALVADVGRVIQEQFARLREAEAKAVADHQAALEEARAAVAAAETELAAATDDWRAARARAAGAARGSRADSERRHATHRKGQLAMKVGRAKAALQRLEAKCVGLHNTA